MPRHVVRHQGHNNRGRSIVRRAAAAAPYVARRANQLYKRVKKAYKKKETKTKSVKKYRGIGNSSDSHSGIQRNTIRVGNKSLKMLKGQTTCGRWVYAQTYKSILTSGAGLQGVTTLVSPVTASKCLLTSGNTYSVEQNDVALEQLNPYLTNTGSAYLPTVVTPLTDRFIIKSVALELELTSFSAVGTRMDIYICVAKKAGGLQPIVAWNAGLAQQNQGQPIEVAPGAGTVGGGVIGYPTNTVPHVKPNEARAFRDFWKVLAVKTVEFTGNSTEILNIDIDVNRVVKMVDVRTYYNSGINNMPNMTYSVFAVQRGAVVADITSGVGGSETVTYGSTKVGMCLIERYTMCGVKGNSGRLDVSANYTNIGTGTAFANQTLLNEVDVQTTVTAGTVA